MVCVALYILLIVSLLGFISAKIGGGSMKEACATAGLAPLVVGGLFLCAAVILYAGQKIYENFP